MLAVAAVAEPVPLAVAVAAGQLVQLELVASAAPGPPLLAGGQPVPTGHCPLVSVVQPLPPGWLAEGQPAQLLSALPAGHRSVAPASHLSTLLSSLMMMMLLMTMLMRAMRMMTLLMLMIMVL